MPGKPSDISGKIFGRLKTIKIDHFSKAGKVVWECVCDCGKKAYAQTSNLTSGHTRSCGCLAREILLKRSITHGFKHTRFYNIWCNIVTRCSNSNDHNYKKYGARGIKLEWDSFESFRDDMHEGYLEHSRKYGENNTSIERIDNEGHYCKENCRWATPLEQGNNKRNNVFLTLEGKTMTAAQWAREKKWKPGFIINRLRLGWSTERTLTTPPFKR